MSFKAEMLEKIGVGTYVKPDGWPLGECLIESDWDKAAFRLPTSSAGPIKSLAVNITITGRKTYSDKGWPYGTYVRVGIEFVGDGEPSTHTVGYASLTPAKTHGGY